MANREENLEKINSELEKLTDEQLEQVAGGLRSPSDRSGDILARRLGRERRESEEQEAAMEKWEFYKRFMAEFRLEKSKLELKKQFESSSRYECYPAADIVRPPGPITLD